MPHTLVWVNILTSGEPHSLPAEHWPTDGGKEEGADGERRNMWRDEVSRGLIIEKKYIVDSRDTDRREELLSLQSESIPTELISV